MIRDPPEKNKKTTPFGYPLPGRLMNPLASPKASCHLAFRAGTISMLVSLRKALKCSDLSRLRSLELFLSRPFPLIKSLDLDVATNGSASE